MRYLRQFGIILMISFIGEILHALIPLPVPASVYGLLLLLFGLSTGFVRLEHVKDAANYLIEIMPVMFIPAAAGLLDAWPVLQPIWFPVLVITILTTVLVMAAAGVVTQWMQGGGKAKKDQDNRREK